VGKMVAYKKVLETINPSNMRSASCNSSSRHTPSPALAVT
jgi:hypothetical protein